MSSRILYCFVIQCWFFYSYTCAYPESNTPAIFLKTLKQREKIILFTPETNVKEILIELINKEKKGIFAAQYRITDKDITQALINAHARGVRIQCITDASCVREKSNTLDLLSHHNIPIWVYNIPWRIMHLKIWLFKKNEYGSHLIWTGSANATRVGTSINRENILIWKNNEDYYLYRQEFDKIIDIIENRKN